MYAVIKFITIIATLFLLCYPFLPFKAKVKKVFTLRSLSYEYPDNKHNVIFLIISVVWLIIISILFSSLSNIVEKIISIPFIEKLLSKASDKTEFIEFVFLAILGNLIIIYGFTLIKTFIVKLLPIANKFAKEDGEEQELISKDKKEEDSEEEGKKISRVVKFEHSGEGKSGEENIHPRPFVGLFFQKTKYLHAKTWVVRLCSILQSFVNVLEILYVFLFFLFMLCIFFPVSDKLYVFLNDSLHVKDWYIYPFISFIVLQEICNIFKTKPKGMEDKDDKEEEKAETLSESEAKLTKLENEIKKRFDKDHFLRYFPVADRKTVEPYEWTNVPYNSALAFVKSYMIAKRKSSNVEEIMEGKEFNDEELAVQSYLEALDSAYNGNNIYICASFFSEFGEYLIAYTYTRLLAGSRLIYVVPNAKIIPALRKYVSSRLLDMTGCTEYSNWRVCSSEERLDQADVLIASPDDFKDDNLVEHFPSFFTEACNAVFIDADNTVTLHSYLCTVISSRLLKASNNEIKFIFLSKTVLRGFAAEIIPKYFCISNVLTYTSAQENEEVSYTFWNKESRSNRVYDKNGQTLTSIECILAELAYECDIDGIRVVSESPFERADLLSLTEHKVEVNSFYKKLPDINYMIYSDERCNLSAALYTCTRFRGGKKSAVNIISKPYLLREYFASKAITEDYINRSSFIQPHVTEHSDNQKLSFVRLYCDATVSGGLHITEFITRVDDIIKMSRERGELPLTEYCRRFENSLKKDRKIWQYASYVLSALYDYKDAPIIDSITRRIKDYYLITSPHLGNGYELSREKSIEFKRVGEIFNRLFECRERVSLKLNDKVIGELNTFPTRVRLQYVEGQSIVYDNCEYEIEQISSDNKSIYLRRENVTFKNTLDTVFLRRYQVDLGDKISDDGIFHNSQTLLAEIRVSKRKAHIIGETYGFYSLLSGNQTLDFKHGVVGNPHFDEDVIAKNRRDLVEGRLLHVTLTFRDVCNDNMRMLMSTVLNEFIKTLFPDAYRCIAVCPILSNSITSDEVFNTIDFETHVKYLYPHLVDNHCFSVGSSEMQFLIINDCVEDVGVIDAFYDHMAHNMQEFLANVYAYLYWLKQRPNLTHYIYFGDSVLPGCFDLKGCCDLLTGLNITFSDNGVKDYPTAVEVPDEQVVARCAFCHKVLESGRYKRFDANRFICTDCFDTLYTDEELQSKLEEVLSYLKKTYPKVTFPTKMSAKFTKNMSLEKGEVLSEYYYNLDASRKIICVEQDLPIRNIEVSLLRGIIEQWQLENKYILQESKGQLYFEELKYLRSKGLKESSDCIYDLLDDELKYYVNIFVDYTGEQIVGDIIDEEDGEASTDNKTSFDYVSEKAEEESTPYTQEVYDEDSSDDLYNPNSVPRFWKRYLTNANAFIEEDDGNDVDECESENGEGVIEDITDNAPFEDFGSDGENDDIQAEESEGEGLAENGEEPPYFEDIGLEELNSNESEEEVTAVEDVPQVEEGENFTQEEIDEIEEESEEIKDSPIEETDEEEEEVEKEEPKKKERKPFFNFKKKKKGSSSKKAMKFAPPEEEEENNPLIKFYMSIVRGAYDYSEARISTCGLSDKEIERVFRYVQYDYPELFWLKSIEWGGGEAKLLYRCITPNGQVDVRQIERKRREIKSAAKDFTYGITKKTNPYDALLKIYRRLILKLDYDEVGLIKGNGNNVFEDDVLRSLYSAIVTHKVVCAGYACALQYLAQSVGISCGYVTSEALPDGSSHAFNMLKIGRYCYYVDATWGDRSNTATGDKDRNRVDYDYFCVPFKEFTLTPKGNECLHVPNKVIFPYLKEINCTNHEYYRYHDAYLQNYDFDALVEIFVSQALNYDDREMGDFIISFKASNNALAKYLADRINKNGTVGEILKVAKLKVGKNKRALQLLNREYYQAYASCANVVYIESIVK